MMQLSQPLFKPRSRERKGKPTRNWEGKKGGKKGERGGGKGSSQKIDPAHPAGPHKRQDAGSQPATHGHTSQMKAPSERTNQRKGDLMERDRSSAEQEGEMVVAAAWGLGATATVTATASSLPFFCDRAKEIRNYPVVSSWCHFRKKFSLRRAHL